MVYLLPLNQSPLLLKRTCLSISIYSHVLQVSVNYCGNSSCDECIYQPYMERQQTTLVIVRMMNTHLEAFVNNLVFHLIISINFCECMTLVSLIRFPCRFVNATLIPFLLLVWGSLRFTPRCGYTTAALRLCKKDCARSIINASSHAVNLICERFSKQLGYHVAT